MSTSGAFSTSGDIMMHVGDTTGDVQYIGGYHEYIGGYISTSGDIMNTSGMFSTSGGYHGGAS